MTLAFCNTPLHIATVDNSNKKSTKKPRGKPFVKGDPRIQRGRGPAKGAPNAGRPPDAWKALMRDLRDRFLIAAEANGVVDDPDHPQWAKVGTWVHEQLEGRAPSKLDVTSGGKSLVDILTAIASDKP